MKIFMISPVREISDPLKDAIANQVNYYESLGHDVYWPHRDTNQSPEVNEKSYQICRANKVAIENADEVYIIWDGKSQGCLFDLGIAFALGKKVHPVLGYFPKLSKEKSFQNFVYEYEDIE